ncbi:MAG: hypothetical protein CSA47_02310 [Gammaproteobacteria bacterium]|nr:MAG: hypothetical protein CSA47_02310 [Gammaproteobacteria bacterium]
MGKQLSAIELAIDDFQRTLYAFDREYQRRLGDLVESVLTLRARLGLTAVNTASVTVTKLTDERFKQLKSAYRKASKLCHPDHLSVEQLDAGLELFDTLNKAYRLQDITMVEYILWQLQTGQAFQKQAIFISDIALLQQQRNILEHLIVQKTDILAQLKTSEDYDVSNKDNWNILLYDYQTQLEDELAVLRGKGAAQANYR